MPVNARIWPGVKTLEYSVSSTASVSESGDGDPTYSHSATGATDWAVNAINLASEDLSDPKIYIWLNAQSSFDGSSGSWSVTYNGPGAPFGGYTVSGATYRATVTIAIRLVGLVCYWNGNPGPYVPRYSWTGVEVYVNGSLDTTLSSHDTGADAAGTGPQYVPVVGLPFYLTGSCAGNRTNLPTFTYDPCDPEAGADIAWSTETTSTVSGGWRFQETDDSWHSLPVTLYSISAPSGVGCPYGIGAATISAGTTSSTTISCVSHSDSTFEYDSRDLLDVLATLTCTKIIDDTVTTHEYTGESEATSPCGGGTVQAWHDIYKTTTHGWSQGGTIWLMPDLERTIHRLGPDYRAMWDRIEVPETKALASRSCDIDGVSSTTSSNPVVHSNEAVLLSVVGSTTATIEDILTQNGYAPFAESAAKSENVSYSVETPTWIMACPPSWAPAAGDVCTGGGYTFSWSCSFIVPSHPSTYKTESVSISFPSSVGSATHYLDHAVDWVRYFSIWGNPHWSLVNFWDDWEIDGETYNTAKGYYQKRRQQWLYNSALPTDEKRRTRNNFVCLDCLPPESSFEPFWDSYMAAQSWIGASRWITRDFTIRTTYTYTSASSPLWTLTDCTASYGTDIALTSTGASTIVAELDLGSWSYAPYMWAHIANKITPDWTTTNISAVRVYVVGVDDPTSKVLLKVNPSDTSTTRATQYDRPRGTTTKYAGSWGGSDDLSWDDGSGGTITILEDGLDYDSGGMSATIMGDPETATAFSLLPGYGGAKLRFEIDVVSTGTAVHLKYPKLDYSVSDDPQMYLQAGQLQTLIWKNGPSVTFGETFWNPSAMTDPPDLQGIGNYNGIKDALAFGRLWFEGKAADDGLSTELTTLYDSYEGSGMTSIDSASLACILPKNSTSPMTVDKSTIRFALVSTPGEVPPMCMFPRRKRDSNWDDTGDYALTAYSWAQERLDHISAGKSPLHLTEAGGTIWTSAIAGVHLGWAGTSHSHEVDNTEDGFFYTYKGAKVGKEIRPWDGKLFVFGQDTDGISIAFDKHLDGQRWRAYLDGGFLVVQKSTRAGSWAEVSRTIPARWGDITIEKASKSPRLWALVSTDAGEIIEYESTDGGETWPVSTALDTGAHNFPASECEIDGVRYAYWVDTSSNLIKGVIRDKAGNNLRGGVFTVTGIGAVDASSSIAVRQVKLAGADSGKVSVQIQVIQSGAPVEWNSVDGQAFT